MERAINRKKKKRRVTGKRLCGITIKRELKGKTELDVIYQKRVMVDLVHSLLS